MHVILLAILLFMSPASAQGIEWTSFDLKRGHGGRLRELVCSVGFEDSAPLLGRVRMEGVNLGPRLKHTKENTTSWLFAVQLYSGYSCFEIEESLEVLTGREWRKWSPLMELYTPSAVFFAWLCVADNVLSILVEIFVDDALFIFSRIMFC